MEISQIQLRFVPEEDRLQLRMNTFSNQQFCFWITRRYLKVFWPAVCKVLGVNPAARDYDERAKAAVKSLENEQMLTSVGARMDEPFHEDATQFPLGEAPILLTDVTIKYPKDKYPILFIHNNDGAGLNIDGGNAGLNFMTKLIVDIMPSTDWGLQLDGLVTHGARQLH